MTPLLTRLEEICVLAEKAIATESKFRVSNVDLAFADAANPQALLAIRDEVKGLVEVANAAKNLLDAYSHYFPKGNPWGDALRPALAKAQGHD